MNNMPIYELAWIAFIGCVTLLCLAVFAFEGWHAFWGCYDNRMQNSKRIKNAEIDRAYTTRQFYVPPTMRDCK